MNVYAHLFTTGMSYVGALGLALAYFVPSSSSASTTAATTSSKKDQQGLKVGPLCAAVTWASVRYTVPDDDVAFALVAIAYALGAYTHQLELTKLQGVGLVVGGMLGQEAAHYFAQEATYFGAYVGEAADAGGASAWVKTAGTLALHNVWLLAFEVRAAVNALTSALVPTAAA